MKTKKVDRVLMRNLLIFLVFGIVLIVVTDYMANTAFDSVEKVKNATRVRNVILMLIVGFTFYRVVRKNTIEVNTLKKLIEENNNKYSKLLENSKDYALTNVNKLSDKVFKLSNKVIVSDISNEEFIVEFFDLAFEFQLEWNLGSAFIVEKDKVKFLKTVGFNLDVLNDLKMSPEGFLIDNKELTIVNSLPNSVQQAILFTEEDGPEFKRPVKGSSMYIGVSDGVSFVGGISLDYINPSEEKFSKETIEKFKLFQNMFNGLYRLKLKSDAQRRGQQDIVKSLVTAVEIHDKYTAGHSHGVADIAYKIGIKVGLDQKTLTDLHNSALVHDIGKILIPSSILNKTDELTDEEYDVVKMHSTHSYGILKEAKSLSNIARSVLHHHERWDGLGYPYGLKTQEIPVISQILCVADAFNSMTSDKVYKKKISIHEASKELLLNKGTQFSPDIVDALLEILREQKHN